MLRWTVLWGVLALNCGEEPMGRRDYQYVTVTCNKGINQQERLADQSTECSDARNVWAPDGKVVARPGYWGVGTTFNIGFITAGGTQIIESPSGVFSVADLSSLTVGNKWYAGFTGLSADINTGVGFEVVLTNANTNEMSVLTEYWNGSNWLRLNSVETDFSTRTLAQNHLVNLTSTIFVPMPFDVAQSTILGLSAYWFRFTLQSIIFSAAFSTPVVVSILRLLRSISTFNYFVPAQFANTTRFISSYQNSGQPSTPTMIGNFGQIAGPVNSFEATAVQSFVYADDEPASTTVVPQFGETYISYNYIPTVHKAVVKSAADAVSLATVETDPLIVGPNADYDPVFIPQLGTWPQTKYIAFHRGEMWAANFKDGINSIRWSAGSPNYKVWPEINVDVLADRDQSPITGLYPFNQNMYVFKADSIWQMVFTGENDDKLNTYRAERIISGVGCVSNSSIQEINGSLVFLGRDGIYAFDGSATKKISDRINTTISTLVPGRFAWATAVNWRSKSLYLLSIATGGASANNLVLVWDYKNNAWWIWDNVAALHWIYLKTQTNAEQIYFLDSSNRMYELGVGTSDYGTAISAYTITQRVYNPKASNMTRKMRLLEINATNLANSATVEVQANDAPFTGTSATALDFSDANEPVYGTATYGTSTYTGERERIKGAATLLGGEWFRAKISHSSKTTPFSMSWLQFGLTQPEGVRK